MSDLNQEGLDLDEAADALWENLLPHMQVRDHANGSRSAYHDKVAALRLIREAFAALSSPSEEPSP